MFWHHQGHGELRAATVWNTATSHNGGMSSLTVPRDIPVNAAAGGRRRPSLWHSAQLFGQVRLRPFLWLARTRAAGRGASGISAVAFLWAHTAVAPARAEVRPDVFADILQSVADCIADCAFDPSPDYDTCVQNCWAPTGLAYASGVLGALATIQPESDVSELDVRQFERAISSIRGVQRTLDETGEPGDVIAALRALFFEDFDSEFIRARAVAPYFILVVSELATSRSQEPDWTPLLQEMLLEIATNSDGMARASVAGRAGVLAVGSWLATGEGQLHDLESKIVSYGLTWEVGIVKRALGPCKGLSCLDSRAQLRD